MTASAFAHSSGPRTAKVALVGEAWSESDAQVKLPFQGTSGAELTRMLNEAGMKRHEFFLTNVFARRPPDNKILKFFTGKKLGSQAFSPYTKGKFLLPELEPELVRLREELSAVRPNLVVALGGTACWALLGSSGIKALRGTVAESTLVPGLKVLPTFHPSYVLRSWSDRPIMVADFLKVKREREFSEIRRPERRVLVDPTLAELAAWIYNLDGTVRAPRQGYFSCDTETERRQITMIAFADHISEAICIPFVDWRHAERSYWTTPSDELAAWKMVKDILESPYPKLFQNGLYDLQYIRQMGFRPWNVTDDTMLLHHALFPELPKSLAFMGSTQTNEPAWKLMARSKDELKANA